MARYTSMINKSQSHFAAHSQSLRLGVDPTLWTFDQKLLPFQEFGSGICCPLSLWSALSDERPGLSV
jgi:hypothetical protein